MRRSKISKLLRMLNQKRRMQWTRRSRTHMKKENVVPGIRKWNRKFPKENITTAAAAAQALAATKGKCLAAVEGRRDPSSSPGGNTDEGIKEQTWIC